MPTQVACRHSELRRFSGFGLGVLPQQVTQGLLPQQFGSQAFQLAFLGKPLAQSHGTGLLLGGGTGQELLEHLLVEAEFLVGADGVQEQSLLDPPLGEGLRP